MTPPRLLRALARVLLPGPHREFVLGDLDELYARRARERGVVYAAARYVRDLIGSAVARAHSGRPPGPLRERLPGGLRAFLDGLRADVAEAARSLRRQPAFALVVALTLGVGIGSAGALFGIVDQVLFRPIPGAPDQGEAAVLDFSSPDRSSGLPMAWPDVEELRRSSHLLAGFSGFRNCYMLASTPGARPVEAQGFCVFGDYFRLLGVRPIVGRLPTADELRPDADPYVVVISESLWAKLFNRDPRVAGRRFEAQGHTWTVLGVAGDGFRGTGRFWQGDFWAPLSALQPLNSYPVDYLKSRQHRILQFFVVRPSRGVSFKAAQAQVDQILSGIAERTSDATLEDARATLEPGLMDPVVRRYLTGALAVLGAIMILILLIPCANVANLLLVRSAYRRGDVAVKRAMGASAGRIARVQLAESVMLATLGAGVGLGIAWMIGWSYRGWRPLPLGRSGLESLALDHRGLAFACATVLLTTLLFGVVPALVASRFDLAAHLRDASTQSTARHARLRFGMSTLQIALSLPLVVSAMLLARTLGNIYAVEPGLKTDGVAVSSLHVGILRPDDAEFETIERNALDAVERVPGVRAAALTHVGPYAEMRPRGRIVAAGGDEAGPLTAEMRWASPGWLDVLDIELVAGRGFRASDWKEDAPLRVILSAPLAKHLFGSVQAVGRTVRVGLRDLEEAEVVGVIGNVRMSDPRSGPDELVVLSHAPFYLRGNVTVLVRTVGRDAAVLDRAHAALEAAVAELPVPRFSPLGQRIDAQLAEQRLLARLIGLLSALALAVTAVGLYAVIAFAVARRRREFGIRIALGAGAHSIAGLALGSAGLIVTFGTLFGLGLSYALSHLIASRLFGVGLIDAESYAAAIAVLALVTAASCLVPATAAMKVDPVRTLSPE